MAKLVNKFSEITPKFLCLFKVATKSFPPETKKGSQPVIDGLQFDCALKFKKFKGTGEL